MDGVQLISVSNEKDFLSVGIWNGRSSVMLYR